MTIQKLSRILNQHHISHRLTEMERLEAEEVYTRDGQVYTDWIDVTDFTLRQLLDWLGY